MPVGAGVRIRPDDMDPADLKRLMDWAAKAPIIEVEVADSDTRVHLVKASSREVAVPTQAAPEAPESAEYVVAAPLPGTFYLKASPEAAPFASVGQMIGAGDAIGLIEAMKMFNPVTSDVDGVVEAILADSGQEVDVGQPLVRLRAGGTAA